MDFENYGISEKYKKFAKYGDSLHEMGEKIDWESLRPIFRDLYVNDTVNGGRPNIDPIIMVKVLFIQSIYNLVDEQVEKEMHDRLSMMHFLGFPDTIPDSRTTWLFRERLSTTGKDKIMWKGIWKQFEDRGITIKKGTVQDATFVESDPGKHGKKKPPVPPDPSILPIKDVNANHNLCKNVNLKLTHPIYTSSHFSPSFFMVGNEFLFLSLILYDSPFMFTTVQ